MVLLLLFKNKLINEKNLIFILIFNLVNIDNSHTQEIFGILNNFTCVKGF